MYHGLRPEHSDGAHDAGVRNVRLDERDSGRKVAGVAARKIIERHGIQPDRRKRGYEARSYEPLP